MTLTDLGALATAAAVVLVVIQLWFACAQQRTAFEDELGREYGAITRSLPVRAFYDSPSAGAVDAVEQYLADFLRYIDLCNQQALLRHATPHHASDVGRVGGGDARQL